jgi:hypothetical protein
MPPIMATDTTRTVKTRTLELAANDILELIRRSGVGLPNWPSNACVHLSDVVKGARVVARCNGVEQPITADMPVIVTLTWEV